MPYFGKHFKKTFKERVLKKRKYVDLPFLRDKESVSYTRRTRVLFIMRGLPGSGKSYIANQIRHRYGSSSIICSADHFFINDDGEYVYDAKKLREAHIFSQQTCQKAMLMDKKHVIVDNTNVQKFEIDVYLNYAKSYNYVTLVVEPKTAWSFDVEVLTAKNSHACSLECIERKKSQYTDIFPIYWAFFLNDRFSNGVREFAKSHFYKCIRLFGDFDKDFISNNSGSSSYEAYYNIDSNKILHCTTCFLTPETSSYSLQDNVVRSKGKYFDLDVSGFVFTPRVTAAVVKLRRSHIKLWNSEDVFTYMEDDQGKFIPTKYEHLTDNATKHDIISEERDVSNKPDVIDDTLCETIASELELLSCGDDVKLCLTFSIQSPCNKRTTKSSPITMKRGSRAHLTIGCREGVGNVQSGYDVLSLKHLYNLGCFEEIVYENNSTYIYYGEGHCEVRLDWPLKVGTLFAGGYAA